MKKEIIEELKKQYEFIEKNSVDWTEVMTACALETLIEAWQVEMMKECIGVD